MLEGAGGQPDERVGPEEDACLGDRQVGLTEVHAVDRGAPSAGGMGDVGPVVDEHPGARRGVGHGGRDVEDEVEQLAGQQVLGPHLDDAGTGRGRRSRGPHGRRAVAGGDEVETPVDQVHDRSTSAATSSPVTASRASTSATLKLPGPIGPTRSEATVSSAVAATAATKGATPDRGGF